MLFWIGILVGAALAYLAVKTGFYETWVLLFNLTVAIYLGLFLHPLVADFIPAAGGTDFGPALTMLAIAGAVFAILQGLSFVFLTGQFKVPFPKIFDVVVSGILGFCAGLLIWSFVSLLITISPLARETAVEKIGFSPASFTEQSADYLAWWCDIIHNFTASDSAPTAQQAIQTALNSAPQKPVRPSTPQPQQPESHEEAQPTRRPLGPPPEIDPEDL
jgi:hypothetical protein